jgi:hypothetical protein
MNAACGGWQVESIQLFGVTLEYTEAQILWLMGESLSLPQIAERISDTHNLRFEDARVLVSTLAARLLSVGFATCEDAG